MNLCPGWSNRPCNNNLRMCLIYGKALETNWKQSIFIIFLLSLISYIVNYYYIYYYYYHYFYWNVVHIFNKPSYLKLYVLFLFPHWILNVFQTQYFKALLTIINEHYTRDANLWWSKFWIFFFYHTRHRTTPPPPREKAMTPPPHQIDLHTPKST